MRIILTHEQADFDALASLLGAYLLDENAIPVLPRRMNRNVRAFVTLYGLELPFVDPRDLPAEPVEHITLVDTQSLITVRGTGAFTPVRVVDHHPPRAEFPANWTVNTEDVGATTTLFVEALQVHNGELSSLQATLLLLGIYEDTGSLTYSRTTVRDVRAVAYLMEHGADLRLAVSFINHPLSLQQQAFYDQLRANAQVHDIHGHTVIIACGDASGIDEELSSVAHKLRDLFDPDAIFLLVQTRNGVQMIARSTSDHIDVAQIAARFGGGGHDRASAALVRERSLTEVCAELLRLLPEMVRPAVTVAQIMSRDPQVLAPDTPVHEAALRMQRFGYEGYPVVENGQVVGLLTRRAVDRAIAHKLHVTAASLMESGRVSVRPGDSVEYLQRLMTDTGWGQVPVVHPESGAIIGIVTRTDLLKTLAPQPQLPGQLNLADRLASALPPAHQALLQAIALEARQQRLAAYLVGGFVRDLLLERPSLDFDIVVEGDAIALANALSRKYGGRVTTHARFGTAKWYVADSQLQPKDPPQPASPLPPTLDLITARTEFYTHPTALPTVERGSIKLDLHRRDFTINTLALRLDGRHYGDLYDYWGGLNDLRQGLVRVLHSLSFVDDPTRMLRAVRFEQRFDFRIEERTLQLLSEALPLINRVSGDRLRHELSHILDEPRTCQMVARLHALGVLSSIHPDLSWDDWLHARLEALPTENPPPEWPALTEQGWRQSRRELAYALWVLRLSPERAAAVLQRLKIPRATADRILAAIDLLKQLPVLVDASPSAVTACLDSFHPLVVFIVYHAALHPGAQEPLRQYLTCWRKIQPTINGAALRARGLPPGRLYGQILTALRNAWLDGVITTPEQEAALLENLLAQLPASAD